MARCANFYEFIGRIMFYIVYFLNKHDVVLRMIIVQSMLKRELDVKSSLFGFIVGFKGINISFA